MRLLARLALMMLSVCSSGTTTPGSGGVAEAQRGRRIPAIERCDAPTECIVVSRTCCGHCGAAVPGDVRAVNLEEDRARAGRGEPICEGSGHCPDCHADTSPTLVATCRAHRCVAVDLMRQPITACRSDAECESTFSGCCRCGSQNDVAVTRGRVDDYRRMVCGEAPVACPECVGRPSSERAACVEGRCVVP